MPKKHCNIGETTHGRFYETKPRFWAATPFLRNEAKVFKRTPCFYETKPRFADMSRMHPSGLARDLRLVQALGCKHCKD
jgi:hypothetical protein